MTKKMKEQEKSCEVFFCGKPSSTERRGCRVCAECAKNIDEEEKGLFYKTETKEWTTECPDCDGEEECDECFINCVKQKKRLAAKGLEYADCRVCGDLVEIVLGSGEDICGACECDEE